MTDLATLAGSSPAARALLANAQEQLSGVDLEASLLAHATPALFAVGMTEAVFLAAIQLEEAVDRWTDFQHDQMAWDGWTAEQIDAEVLGFLFELVHGQKPCRDCLNGSLLGGLDAIHPDGHQHRQEAAA